MVEASVVFEQLGAHLASGPVLWSTLAAPFVDEGGARSPVVEVDARTSAGPLVVEHAEECDGCSSSCAPTASSSARDPSWHRSRKATPLDPLTPVVGPGRGARRRGRRRRRGGRAAAALGTVLAAAMLVGVAQGALDVARDYALEREQFGVPIGSFQAIKHLLADMYVRVELARTATYAAAAVAADPGAGDPARPAAAAKLLAGEAGDRQRAAPRSRCSAAWASPGTCCRNYFLKRAWVLEHRFGTADVARARTSGRALGEEVASMSADERDGVVIEAVDGVLHIRLDRPERKNALDVDGHRARSSRRSRRPRPTIAAGVVLARHRRRLLRGRRLGRDQHRRRRRGRAPAASSGAPRSRRTA